MHVLIIFLYMVVFRYDTSGFVEAMPSLRTARHGHGCGFIRGPDGTTVTASSTNTNNQTYLDWNLSCNINIEYANMNVYRNVQVLVVAGGNGGYTIGDLDTAEILRSTGYGG